ncbi:hypothetical protein D3C83_37310 [compost metagenome]
MPGTELPKFWLPHCPQKSPPEARRSCAPRLRRSQSGEKLPFASVHVRVVEVTMSDSGLVAV